MFRKVCYTILSISIVGSIWLSFSTEQQYENALKTVRNSATTAEDYVWARIASHLNQNAEIEALEEKDLRFVRAYLRSRLGRDTYMEMVKNDCLDSIAYKLAIFDSKWTDHWCANQYRQVEAWYKNDIMMYMSYRYEASQPETLKHSIKVARQGN